MRRNKIKLLICGGIFCVLIMLASVWYSINFNDARMVVPMDYSTYEFQTKDLPMILSLLFSVLYGISLLITLFFHIRDMKKQLTETNTTRKINPKFGWFGLFGFLGFFGFWSYPLNGDIYPFVFFIFFGFFGFFYEGKMSGTYMDERFRENAAKAGNVSLKAICITAGIALFAACEGRLFGNLDYTLIAVVIILSLGLGFSMFLSEYLLYRYDHDEPETGEE